MVKCGESCFLGAKDCKKRRSCACKCGPLKAINPNLFSGCEDACNASKAYDRPKDHRDYMCNMVGPDVLFSRYGIVDCGYSIVDTSQYCLVNPHESRCTPGTEEFCILNPEDVSCREKEDDKDGQADNASLSMSKMIALVIAMMLLGGIIFLAKK